MANRGPRPTRPPASSEIFDTPLFVGSLGIMVLAVGVLILNVGSPGERAVGLAHVFFGLVAAGAGVIMRMRARPSQPAGEVAARTRLQSLAATAFALGVFSVLAALAMDRLLQGSASMGERLVVLAAAAFAWILPVQVLRWDRVADQAVHHARLSAFPPGYFVLMAGATAALVTTFWRTELTASILILSLAASAIIVGGKFWLDRRTRAGAE